MDILDCFADPNEGYALLQSQMKDIIDRFEADLKKEYLEAKEEAPELIQSESAPIKFLRTDDLDPLKASRRLVLYWKHRKALFSERWLLPMTQSRSGALSKGALELLRSRAYTYTAHPKPVLLFNPQAVTTPEDVDQVTFYLGTVLSDENIQKNGYSYIHQVPEGHKVSFCTKPWEVLAGLPVRPNGINVILPTIDRRKKELRDYLCLQATLMVRHNSGKGFDFIDEQTNAEKLVRLEGMGISRHSLPPEAGGTFDDDKFADWIRMRLTIEDVMGASSPKNNNIPVRLEPSPAGAMVQNRKRPPTGATEGKETLRQRNAERQRRWVKNQINQLSSLQEESAQKTALNAALREENQKLMSLLAQAEYIVAVHTSKADEKRSGKERDFVREKHRNDTATKAA